MPITPDLAERNAVLDFINSNRPVTATVDIIVLATSAVAVTLTTLTPNTAAVQAAVTASLTDLILREGAPGGTILLSKVNEAISTAAGEDNHVISVPAADLTFTTAQVPILGTVTFP